VGVVEGEALVLAEPISFWGGLDPETGEVIDVHHPNHGDNVAGKVLVLPSTRGSTSSASTLAESIKLGTGPIAVVTAASDVAVALGTFVPGLLYGIEPPYAIADEETFRSIRTGDRVRVGADGTVSLCGSQ
jgi:predicted aconitase with swiveling domain